MTHRIGVGVALALLLATPAYAAAPSTTQHGKATTQAERKTEAQATQTLHVVDRAYNEAVRAHDMIARKDTKGARVALNTVIKDLDQASKMESGHLKAQIDSLRADAQTTLRELNNQKAAMQSSERLVRSFAPVKTTLATMGGGGGGKGKPHPQHSAKPKK